VGAAEGVVIEFARPEAFLLALPIAFGLRRALWQRPGIVTALRWAALLCVLALLAEPHAVLGRTGRDLVLLVDRSDSVAGRAVDRARELQERARELGESGDRIAVVSFAASPDVVVTPADVERTPIPPYDATVDGARSDLEAGLERALALIPPQRFGSVVILSDGETTGGAVPRATARAAAQRGVRIDAYAVRRPPVADLAIEDVDVPQEIAVGEPFRYSVWVRSDATRTVPVRIEREGRALFEGTRELRPGLNRLVFADRHERIGLQRYTVEVGDVAATPEGGATPVDRVPENNRAVAVTRALGPRRILLVSPGGRRGRLADALARVGTEVVVTPPESAPLDLDGLDSVRAVVLENVPAEDLPPGSLQTLRTWVQDFGGGLLMTGGRASFGVGGYRASAVEEVLPVSLEVRQEQRRFGLAMAIALDRSGSMSAPAGPGLSKMDLANRGAIAAIELLGPIDSVAVVAVDSEPHVVVPMSDVTDRDALVDRVRRIESMGGGIFVEVAIEEMAQELAEAPQSTKHMVLFADAADAEQPGDYQTFVPELKAAGVTLSVIGLGTPTDTDAQLLRDIAALGGGRASFVENAGDLPRVFAQETLQVARSSFVEEATAIDVLPDVIGLGELSFEDPLTVGGYSIAYRKPGASVGMRTRDDVGAPMLAFWQAGLGRTAAFLGEVDGEWSGGLATFSGYTDLFATIGRWLGGSRADDRVWSELRRDGDRAILTVELAAGAEDRIGSLRAFARPGGGAPRELYLQRVGERRLEARFRIDEDEVWRTVVQTGDDAVVTPAPVVLPYSPEFEPRPDPREGERNLDELVTIGGGRLDPPEGELYDGPRETRTMRPVGAWFAWALLALVLLEIAIRRLELAPVLGRTFGRVGARGAALAGGLFGALARRRSGTGAETPVRDAAPADSGPRAADPAPSTDRGDGRDSASAEGGEPVARPDGRAAGGIGRVLDRARKDSGLGRRGE
jgi:uncharacterized membrane protein